MWLKQAVLRALGSEGLYAPYGRRRARHSIAVVTYHELCEDDVECDAWTVLRRRDFLLQLDYLREHYEIVSLDQALQWMNSGEESTRPLAVLTFDDGDAGNHRVLLPIVEQERLPVTLYIATGQVEQQQVYWFDRVINAVQTTQVLDLDLRGEGLDLYRINRERGAGNWTEIERLLSAFKGVDPKRREVLAENVVAKAGGGARADLIHPLSIQQIGELAESPYVTIGAHSHCHNLLPQISLEDARVSITRSRDLLQSWTGRKVHHFAYPNGDYTTELMHAVRAIGFTSAMSTRRALWKKSDDLMAIPRIGIGRYDSLPAFKVSLFGVIAPQRRHDPGC